MQNKRKRQDMFPFFIRSLRPINARTLATDQRPYAGYRSTPVRRLPINARTPATDQRPYAGYRSTPVYAGDRSTPVRRLPINARVRRRPRHLCMDRVSNLCIVLYLKKTVILFMCKYLRRPLSSCTVKLSVHVVGPIVVVPNCVVWRVVLRPRSWSDFIRCCVLLGALISPRTCPGVPCLGRFGSGCSVVRHCPLWHCCVVEPGIGPSVRAKLCYYGTHQIHHPPAFYLQQRKDFLKILSDYEDIDRNMFFKLKEGSRTTLHKTTLLKKQCRLDMKTYLFSQRTVNE